MPGTLAITTFMMITSRISKRWASAHDMDSKIPAQNTVHILLCPEFGMPSILALALWREGGAPFSVLHSLSV